MDHTNEEGKAGSITFLFRLGILGDLRCEVNACYTGDRSACLNWKLKKEARQIFSFADDGGRFSLNLSFNGSLKLESRSINK